MISVIIPTYKPQDYLWRCLDSLYKQTLPASHFEVILILNGERDPWHHQITQYLSKQTSKLTVRFFYTEYAGVSHARNIGIEEAKGEYIAFIDDDDYVSPSYLEQLSHIATKDTIALSNTIAFDSKTAALPYSIAQEYARHANKGILPFYVPKKYFSGPCMKLIHKDIIGNRRFNPAFTNGEDSLFMFTISDAIRYAQFTPSDAIYYRNIRVGSATTSISTRKRISDAWNFIVACTILYWQHPFKYKTWFYITRCLGAFHRMISKT